MTSVFFLTSDGILEASLSRFSQQLLPFTLTEAEPLVVLYMCF